MVMINRGRTSYPEKTDFRFTSVAVPWDSNKNPQMRAVIALCCPEEGDNITCIPNPFVVFHAPFGDEEQIVEFVANIIKNALDIDGYVSYEGHTQCNDLMFYDSDVEALMERQRAYLESIGRTLVEAIGEISH